MRLRPPAPADAEAVLAVMVARDIADVGHPDCTLQDVLDDWSAADVDPRVDCVVAEDDDGAIVGYAVTDARSAMVFVHPESERRGIGTALREAMEARARERGEPVRQTIAANNPAGIAHLRAAGYERRHVYQRMRATLESPPFPLAPVHRFDLGRDGRAVHELVEAAFSEIEGNVAVDYATWRSRVAGRSEPAFRLALDDVAGLAGVAIGERWEEGVGYVAQLAVAPRARGHGHGRTLLLAMLGAFHSAGLTAAELSVHGANAPATRLYESVGMMPTFRQELWGRESEKRPRR